MTVTADTLGRLARHWAVSVFSQSEIDRVRDACAVRLVQAAVGPRLTFADVSRADTDLMQRVATAYEFAAAEGLTALLYPSGEPQNMLASEIAQAAAFESFNISRVLDIPSEDGPRMLHILHLASLAYTGERWADLRRWLREHKKSVGSPEVPSELPWDMRILYRVYDAWIRLLRKESWDDLNGVADLITQLRTEQRYYEGPLLDNLKQKLEAAGLEDISSSADSSVQASLETSKEDSAHLELRAMAFRLAALYHWVRATELLALYMLQGEPRGVDTSLDQHFEAAREAARGSLDPSLEVVLRWLHVAARRMVAGSVWWVSHTVNSRVSRFVDHVTKSRGMFELLPPQRIALREQGLLDVANRAIVVDMPTSGGKTVLAQFRMLQALNLFSAAGGWVAYVAPTRALVSQITRRLRADFGPLNIEVEQLSAAVEIDTFEDAILSSVSAKTFDILVATPEKLQLVIRTKKISRPLALIVMDEAHNIEDEQRGLRIELLLATIKSDCPDANFLLLTPFIPNAAAIATWLGPEGNKAISLGTTEWRPNERIVGLFHSTKEDLEPHEWQMEFETLTTTRSTIDLRGKHRVGSTRPLELTPGESQSGYLQAGAMALVFGDKRRTSIAIAQTIPLAWKMARKLASSSEVVDASHNISLVQRFLATEISPDFELIGMLSKGIGVHHSGLSEETRSLVEWLAEEGELRVLCATSTLAQGINFPVSSVFLASRMIASRGYSREMSPRAFWNLAGRAGRMDQDSVGVIGIAAGKDPTAVTAFVSKATGDLVSRLTTMLAAMEDAGTLGNLDVIIQQEQWSDFRSYVAHLWNEKKNLDEVLADTELFLRNTFGYRSLQGGRDESDRKKARALLDATKNYVRKLAEHPENAALADATGFAPEGVSSALIALNRFQLERRLTLSDWTPSGIFGSNSALPRLVGIMLQVPEIRNQFNDFSSAGNKQRHIAEVAQAWVAGASIEEIAKRFFLIKGSHEVALTDALTAACRGIYRTLATAGAWGLSALTKMPTSGIDFSSLSDEERRLLNSVPAMLYHGVRTEAAVMMRMNSVPRTMAEPLGLAFSRSVGTQATASTPDVREYLRALSTSEWHRHRPAAATMSGADYREVWARLSGEVLR